MEGEPMKKAKRLTALALSAVFTMTVLLTACSSNEESPENQTGAKPPKEGEQITLKFSFWGDTIEKKTVTEALKRFEQETGIIVEPMHVPSDYLTKLTTMVAGNV